MVSESDGSVDGDGSDNGMVNSSDNDSVNGSDISSDDNDSSESTF